MSFDTYANLQDEVALWLRRSDLTDRIKSFIALAETQMNAKLRVPPMLTTSTPSISAETLTVPTDLLEVKTFRLTSGSGRSLTPITEEQAQSYKSTPTVVSTEPRTYVRRSTVFEFTPVPDKAYTSALVYYQKIPGLTDSNTSNWLLDAFPHAYLYGALMASAPFLKDDGRLSTWAPMFADALDDIRSTTREAFTRTLVMDAGMRTRRGFNIQTGDFQ